MAEEDIEKICKKLSEIEIKDSHIKEYLDETIICLKNKCYRSTVILFWNLFMYFLYKKIEEYGLKNFAKFTKEKKISFNGQLNNYYDLNKLKDNEVLILCRDLSFYDRNIFNRLIIYTQLRGSCAHVTQPKITEYGVFDFLDSLIKYIEIINRLSYQDVNKNYLESLKQMNEEEIHQELESMKFEELLPKIKSTLDKISFIKYSQDYEKNKNLFDFIFKSIEIREDEEKLKLFKLIFEKYISGEMEDTFMLMQYSSNWIKFAPIKKYIFDQGYIDFLITSFVESNTYRIATINTNIIHSFNNWLTPEQVNTIAKATLSNDQILSAYGVKSKLKMIFLKHKKEISRELIDELKKEELI
ncbi:MAG: hypothetical protein KKB39_03505 [Nanoarchaeota archaeon]|nr:hypothetical protein [Nanoarchaeota archaeon]